MPSVTKTALCTVDYCPAKNDPWWHVCVVCENNVIEHAHIIARSQAPERRNDPNNVVPLCHREHDLVSRHIWTFVEQAMPFGGIHQWLRDDKGVTVWSRDIGASTGEGEGLALAAESAPSAAALPSPAGASGVPSAAAEVPDSGSGADALAVAPGASRGLPGERVGRDSEAGAQPAALSGETPSENLAVTPPDSLGYVHSELIYQALDNGIEIAPEITFEHWAVMARKMIAESKGRQWKAGDTLNAGERFGERCWQYLDEFDYPIETLANYGRVAAAYKLAERRPLSFGHHQAVYKHPARKSLLDLAVEGSWTVKELKLEAYPDTRIRIRRFTIEELRGLFQDWLKAEQRNRYNVGDFLDWLEKA